MPLLYVLLFCPSFAFLLRLVIPWYLVPDSAMPFMYAAVPVIRCPLPHSSDQSEKDVNVKSHGNKKKNVSIASFRLKFNTILLKFFFSD